MELHTVCFRGNYQRNEIVFFLLAFFVSKSICNNIFLLPTDLPTDKKLPTIHRWRLSVGDFVGDFFTNEMVVQILTKNFVDKSKDFGSAP